MKRRVSGHRFIDWKCECGATIDHKLGMHIDSTGTLQGFNGQQVCPRNASGRDNPEEFKDADDVTVFNDFYWTHADPLLKDIEKRWEEWTFKADATFMISRIRVLERVNDDLRSALAQIADGTAENPRELAARYLKGVALFTLVGSGN